MYQTFSTVPQPKPQTVPLNVLVTGAARGIGFELVRQYTAAHPLNRVVATVRDPSQAGPLTAFAAAHPNVHLVPLDTSDDASITRSLTLLPPDLTHLDLLWNNAGVMGAPTPLPQLTADTVNATLRTNVTGPLLVVQAYRALLLASPNQPKVINVSSELGATHLARPVAEWGVIPYGASKAALNFISLALATAVPEVIFLSVSPGWVGTDMGSSFHTEAPVKTVDSVSALIALAQAKGREDTGGFFDVVTGKKLLH